MNSRAYLQPQRRTVSLRCFSVNPRTSRLRELLKQPGVHPGPCCHDALSAKLIEDAGFKLAFMSGFCTSAASIGMPDTGLISYAEMQQVGRSLHEATSSIPIIGDGDTGYGNAMNVKRTVRGYASAGFAGILIEDQVAPKSCGHVRDKQVVGRDDAIARIQAAVDAREEGSDILIVARTDARQAESMDEALERAERFAAAGADILFIDALESAGEMQRFAELRGPGQNVPKMASMLEGGGKTPLLSRAELANMNFKIVAYPLSLLGVSVRAMQRALVDLQEDRIPDGVVLPSFAELQSIIGFPEYFKEAEKYSTLSTIPSSSSGSCGGGAPSATPSNSSGSSSGSKPTASSSDRIETESEGSSSSGAGESGGVAGTTGTRSGDKEKEKNKTSESDAAEAGASGATAAGDSASGSWDSSRVFSRFAEASAAAASAELERASAAEDKHLKSSRSAGASRSNTGGSQKSSMGSDILDALAESASAGIGISAAVMAIAKELEPLMNITSSASSTQQQGGRADRDAQQAAGAGKAVSPEEFQGAEEWYREWRRRRSGEAASGTTSSSSSSGHTKESSASDSSSSPAADKIGAAGGEPEGGGAAMADNSGPASGYSASEPGVGGSSSLSSTSTSSGQAQTPGGSGSTGRSMADVIKNSVDAIEADAVIEPEAAASAVVPTTATGKEQNRQRSKVDFSNVSLRIVVKNISTGQTTLDTRLPAQWMGSVASMVPQLAGVDLEEAIKQIQGGSWTPSNPVAQFLSGQELTSIYIEENK